MTTKSAMPSADQNSEKIPDEEINEETAAEEGAEEETVDATGESANNSEASENESTPEEENEQDMIERLEREIAEKDDKYLRLQAEFENFKRRNSQEIKTRFKFAGQPLALSFLPGLDNLERALDQSKAEETEQMKEFITGIEMVQQQFYDALKEHSIERIYPINEPFDPNKHEAMGVVEAEDVEPDHIAQVFQAGYIYHDRVIRPAVVQVAKKK